MPAVALVGLVRRTVWLLAAPVVRLIGVRVYKLRQVETQLSRSLASPRGGLELQFSPYKSRQAAEAGQIDAGLGYISGLVEVTNGEIVHNSRFSSVFVGRDLLMPPRIEAGPYSLYKGRDAVVRGGIVGQNNQLVAVRHRRKARQLSRVLYVGTRAPGNWYHWIANSLPSIFGASIDRKYDCFPLVLPAELRNVPQILQSLELFRNGRELVWLGPDERVVAETLTWALSPVYDAPYASTVSRRKPHGRDFPLLRQFHDAVLQNFPHSQHALDAQGKYFLARGAGRTRSYNELELITVARRFGFTVVDCEQLSFSEQVEIFQNARFLVGAVGAAFANIIFAAKRLDVVFLSGPLAEFENYFSALSLFPGQKLHYLQGSVANGDRRDRSFVVRPQILEAKLAELTG